MSVMCVTSAALGLVLWNWPLWFSLCSFFFFNIQSLDYVTISARTFLMHKTIGSAWFAKNSLLLVRSCWRSDWFFREVQLVFRALITLMCTARYICINVWCMWVYKLCLVVFSSFSFFKLFWNCHKMSSNAAVVVVFVIVVFVLVDQQQWALHFQIFFHTAHRRLTKIVHDILLAHSTTKCNRVFLNGTSDTVVQLTLFQQILRWYRCDFLVGSYHSSNSIWWWCNWQCCFGFFVHNSTF